MARRFIPVLLIPLVFVLWSGCASGASIAFGDAPAPVQHDTLVRFRTDSEGFGVSERSTGTGFFYGNGRTVISTAHLFPGRDVGSRVNGTVAGRELVFRIVAVDRDSDLCVLRSENYLSPVYLTAASSWGVGESIIIAGFPSHIPGYTDVYVSAGVISSDRFVEFTQGDNAYRLIPTDAFATVGNSGGPVINGKGQVVGMVLAVLSQKYAYEGVTLFIPIEMLEQFVEASEMDEGYDYLED